MFLGSPSFVNSVVTLRTLSSRNGTEVLVLAPKCSLKVHPGLLLSRKRYILQTLVPRSGVSKEYGVSHIVTLLTDVHYGTRGTRGYRYVLRRTTLKRK